MSDSEVYQDRWNGSGIISSLLLTLFDGTPWTMGWIIALFTAASALMALTVQIKR